MWTYLPELLARPVPRYTSYPTAMEFSDGVGTAQYMAALDDVPQGTPISLYVHIPFCEQICWYCGCNTGAAGRKQRLSDYLDALKREITMVARRLGGRARVQRIAFGGGSPNAIAPVDFIRLLDHITTLFDAGQPQISVELDPRGLTSDWILALSAAGVERVSLGVQTFASHVQQAIGRVQPKADIEAAMTNLRAHGIEQVNFDLMFGLPGQSLADLDDTLSQTIKLAPSRISLFGYAHLPALLPRQRRIDGSQLPDHELRFRQAHRGYQRLTDAGYQAIGFDHFARPDDALAKAARLGRVHRNFQGFTDDSSDILIGFGASAISQFRNLICQNEKRAGVYRDRVNGGDWATERGVMIVAEDAQRGDIIRAILCQGRAKVPPAMLYSARNALVKYEAHGLMMWQGDMVILPPYALPYARLIAAEFDQLRGQVVSEYLWA